MTTKNRTRRERVCWRIALMLDRLPGTCWANLVSWALDGKKPEDGYVAGLRQNELCRFDAASCGGVCYCGKIGKAGRTGAAS